MLKVLKVVTLSLHTSSMALSKLLMGSLASLCIPQDIAVKMYVTSSFPK